MKIAVFAFASALFERCIGISISRAVHVTFSVQHPRGQRLPSTIGYAKVTVWSFVFVM